MYGDFDEFIVTDPYAYKFIYKHLEKGFSSLGAYMLRTQRIYEGRIVGIFQSERYRIRKEKRLELDPVLKNDPRRWILSVFLKYLRSSVDKRLILYLEETIYEDPDSLDLSTQPTKYKNEWYACFCGGEDVQYEALDDTLYDAEKFQLFGALCTLPDTFPRFVEEFTDEHIGLIARHTEHLIFEAFDSGDGYLVWSRPGLEVLPH